MEPPTEDLPAVDPPTEVLPAAGPPTEVLPVVAAAAADGAGRAIVDGYGGNAPAATFVSAVVTGDAATLCWLGDSRAYWLGADGSGAQRLTRDDSLAEEMVATGLLDAAEALATPQAHVVTRWVGADLAGEAAHVVRFEPPGNGVLLLCSDGLWNYAPDAADLAARALPRALTDPLGAAASLVAFALSAGGHDNVTAVLVPFPPGQVAGRRGAPGNERDGDASPHDRNPEETAPMSQPDFTVDIYQNEFLPDGGQDVSAVITVTSGETVPAAPPRKRGAEIIIIDCSGSMGSPRTKIAEARAATAAAVEVIRDGVAFAVIAGNTGAQPVFPADGSLAIASPASQARGAAGGGRAAARRRDRDRPVAAAGPADVPRPSGHAAARHPAHRRQEPAREPGPAGRGHPAVRGRVRLRLPWRGHRLGGG